MFKPRGNVCVYFLLFWSLLSPEGSRLYYGGLRAGESIPVPARSIGPANMGGRITEIAVDPTNSSRWVVATASSGLWITENAGLSWTTSFDRQSTSALGAVAINPKNPREIWVGTGEPNPRNSVSQGDGVYVSFDNGQTWQKKGLASSRHIGRIVIDPRNPSRLFVAALGPLWNEGGQRGLFLTENAGQTWKQVLPIPADVGAVDVQLDPHDPSHIVACAYRVRRGPFAGGNPQEQFASEAGIYQSKDGGKSFHKAVKGLPLGTYGRCGIDFDRTKPGHILAVIQTGQTKIVSVPDQVPSLGIPGPVETGGIFETLDGGENWAKVNDLCPRPFYFGQIRVDPAEGNRIWVLGIPLFLTADGGKSFRSDMGFNVHPDHHALVFDPKDPRTMILGTDGGLYSSKDRGRSWVHHNNMVLAQFYAVDVDDRTPFRVMGGLQDNGTWIGPSRTNRPEGILASDWSRLFGADGFQAKQDPFTTHIAYLESQNGGLRRHDFRAGLSIDIRPRPSEMEPALRFEWNAPLIMSRHTPNAIYLGANYVFRSEAKGANWKQISPDLTRGVPGPDAQSGNNLSVLAEDVVDPRCLWAGSDDGLLHVTHDLGKNWSEVGNRLPLVSPGWIRAICPLAKGKGSALVGVDRHRVGDDHPYLFQTLDAGKSWTDLSSKLSNEGERSGFVHVVLEHPTCPGFWFVGTENGLWCSVNAGESFFKMDSLPTVPVHGLVVSKKTGELVVGTHGRGVWILDLSFVTHVQKFGLPKAFSLLNILDFDRGPLQRPTKIRPGLDFIGTNPKAGVELGIYVPKGAKGLPQITIVDPTGKTVTTLMGGKTEGFQSIYWVVPNPGLMPVDPQAKTAENSKKGRETVYRVTAELDGQRIEKSLLVRENP